MEMEMEIELKTEMEPKREKKSGEALIKVQYLIKDAPKEEINLKYVSEKDKQLILGKDGDCDGAVEKGGDEEKATKCAEKRDNGSPEEPVGAEGGGEKREGEERGSSRKRMKLKGQNKQRRNKMKKEMKAIEESNRGGGKSLCYKFVAGLHDEKVGCPRGGEKECHFSHDVDSFLPLRKADIGPDCYVFGKYGFCPFGLLCRFGTNHLNPEDGKTNVIDEQKWSHWQPQMASLTSNGLNREQQHTLRKKKYDFSLANRVAKEVEKEVSQEKRVGPALTSRPEMKKVDFKDKLYLAPLTTVGNLPFRRVCKELGADITCGEMAMASNLLEGQQSEWALLRKHSSEDCFGVQLCGAHPDLMARVCQIINETCSVDFVDLNMGCPIDFVYQRGAGSGLMGRAKKLKTIVSCMTRVLDVPLTLKMRTGVYENKHIAHEVIETVKEWDGDRIGCFTVHGRSREGRYTKQADWDYIESCASAADPIPLLGSGDILSFEDLDLHLKKSESKVSGTMIARGALIKPWLFTELKERRHWDISSHERLEILRKYVNYGIEHWGSDLVGVEKTRRFLLEWLSFLHRYIPVGLLEVVPQKINERPPPFKGRDDLETLMASHSCGDWIKISEMLLGPVPDNFLFLPKHKANAYH